jgi:hypothetical protein
MSECPKGSVMFKIKAKSCRAIYDYSYRPHEKELLLPPMSQFEVMGIFEASQYNISLGDQVVCST